MINWMHFPKNKPLDEVSAQIVKLLKQSMPILILIRIS